MISQNFFDDNKYRTSIAEIKKICLTGYTEIVVMKQLMWSVIKSVETEGELNLLNRLIMHYLDNILLQGVINGADSQQDKLKAHTIWQHLRTFYCTSVWTKRANYSLPFFKGRMHLGRATTNASEAEFKVVKTKVEGTVDTTDSISRSAKKMNELDESRNRRKKREDNHLAG